MKRFLRTWWPPLAWISVITVMSSSFISARSFTSSVSAGFHVSTVSVAGFWDRYWWVFVKGFHFGEFALLYLLLNRCTSWRLALVGSIAFAVLDEFHQSFIPYRGGRITDVMIDIAGALIMALSLWLVTDRRTLYPHRPSYFVHRPSI